MTPQERNEVRELAKKNHKGDLNSAAMEWLGAKPEEIKLSKEPKAFNQYAGSAHAIAVEVETYADQDAAEAAAATPTAPAKTTTAKATGKAAGRGKK